MCDLSLSRPRGRMINLPDAVGTVLAHDITEIRYGAFKGASFKKGHIVTLADLEHLARLGKNHLYVLDIPPEMMHEDDAALILAQSLAGEGVEFNPRPSEGKINLVAACDGLLKVKTQSLVEFNMVEGVMCAGRHNNSVVKKPGQGDGSGGRRNFQSQAPGPAHHRPDYHGQRSLFRPDRR